MRDKYHLEYICEDGSEIHYDAPDADTMGEFTFLSGFAEAATVTEEDLFMALDAFGIMVDVAAASTLPTGYS